MTTITVQNLLCNLLRPAFGSKTSTPPRSIRPTLETLESRDAPAVFPVFSPLDDGSVGTLRWAIQQVNASPDPTNTINFAIGAHGSTQTITLNAALGSLPTLVHPALIDGWSQGGGTGYAPEIQINGNGTSGDGLTDASGGATFRGLAIYRFLGNGVVLNAEQPLVESDGRHVAGLLRRHRRRR
jgi:hypothetical protein